MVPGCLSCVSERDANCLSEAATMKPFDRVVIVGVGLLGGSIGLALRDRQLAKSVVGVGRTSAGLQQARELGAITEVQDDLGRACAGADLAIICTPVQQVAEWVRRCQPLVRSDALITDVGSTKRTICELLQAGFHENFCGSHPLAGSDKSGVAHAQPQLFAGRLAVVTPTERTPLELAERTEALWQALGSRTLRMGPAEHDEAVARTSHLPHLVASALAGKTATHLLPLAASGWCDTTRVAAGNVELWRQIVCENRLPVLQALREFTASLGEWVEALERGDELRLTQLLEIGKQQRDSVGN